MTELPAPALTATLERPPAKTPRLLTPQRRAATRRWWRRRPVNRLTVWLHRWPALILGVLLVIETTAGSVLLYHNELYRLSNGDLYRHTASADPITPDVAIERVNATHPAFHATWSAKDDGVYTVGNADYRQIFFVDPATGRINGSDRPDEGFFGFLVNLHDCAFSCAGYPFHQAWLADPVWQGGPTFLTGITWSAVVLGVLGVLLMLLVLTGLKIWWPALRLLGQRFYRVRRGGGPSGRFARDYDLHNVIAAWAMPFVLMWGLTGAAFEFPGIKDGWIAITGGDKIADPEFSLTPTKVAAGTPQIGLRRATDIALAEVPGRAVSFTVPTKDAPYYEIDVVSGYGSYEHRALYGGGDSYVLVDAHDPSNVKALYTSQGDPAANRFYDKFLEPTHFGWNVNGWWRLIWLAFGLAPLGLMITGVSTWLYRRGVRARRRRAAAAAQAAS